MNRNDKNSVLKIFAFVGSYRVNSKTVKVINDIVHELRKVLDIEIGFKLITPNNLPLENCLGCNKCFYSGTCCIDDNISKYKTELSDADIVILGSPVYLHQVSGNMKNFIDRIAEWIHILKLSGKLGIAISTSSNNGNKAVNEYLKSVLEYLGTSVIGDFSFEKVDFEDESIYNSIIRHCVNHILEKLQNKDFVISENQEKYFLAMKKMMAYQDNDLFEKQYWLKNKYFEYEDFQQLFNKKCKL